MRRLLLSVSLLALLAPTAAQAGGPTVTHVKLAGPTGSVAFAAGAVFVAGASPAEVVDAGRARSAGFVAGSVGGVPNMLAAGGGALFLTSGTTTIARIDPEARRVVAAKEVTGLAEFSILLGLAAAPDGVWTVVGGQGTVRLLRLDPRTLARTGLFAIGAYKGGHGLPQIALGAGSVWVANLDGGLVRVDRATGRVIARIPVPDAAGVAFGAGAVWVTSLDGDALYRVDPRTNARSKAIRVGDCPTAVAVGLGAVWVANACDGTVSRVDPQRRSVGSPIRVGDAPDSFAFGAGAAWVGYDGGTTLGRIVP